MTRLLPLLPLLALAACATPREQCISDANSQLRTLTRLAAESRANLNRGFAVEERQEVRERPGYCNFETDDGIEGRMECRDIDVRTRRVPVSIDLNAERAKLTSIEERLAIEQRRAGAAAQSCLVRYPE